MSRFVLFIVITLIIGACRPNTYTPKPRGYARVELPEHNYRWFNDMAFPYNFQYPVYGRIVKDTLFFGKKPENPYWINIDFASIGGTIYISYKPITAAQPLGKLMEDAHEMSFTAHSKRADYIEEQPFINKDSKVYGLLYSVGGNAATAYQFIATDSVKHFIRGALYFDVIPNADSLRPGNEFLRKDIERLLETLRWNN